MYYTYINKNFVHQIGDQGSSGKRFRSQERTSGILFLFPIFLSLSGLLSRYSLQVQRLLVHFITSRHTPHSVGLPLDEGSALCSELYLTTHNNQRQTSMPPAGFEPVIPSKRAAADPRLGPRSHWNGLLADLWCRNGTHWFSPGTLFSPINYPSINATVLQ